MPLPNLEVLTSSIEAIIAQYHNTDRQDSVKLLKHINSLAGDETERCKIKLGALIWLEKDIKYRDYKGKNPLACYPLFYSTLYYNLNRKLPTLLSSTTKNETLIYLMSFYKYIRQKKESDLPIKNLNTLIDSILNALKIELDEQKELIDKLLKKMPSPKYFLLSFSCMKKEYDTYYTNLGLMHRYMHEPDRDRMVEFLNILNFHLNEIDEKANTVIKRESASYLIRYGAVVFVLSEIDKTYRLMWDSDRSYLYTLCGKVTNLKHPSDLSADETLSCYSNLFNYITNELKSKSFKEKWQELPDAENYLKSINLRLFIKMCMIMQLGSTGDKPTYNDKIKNTLSYFTKLTASYLAGITVGAFSSELAKKTIGATATYFVGPAAGNIIYLLSCAGDYVANSYLPNKISQQVGEKIGATVMTTTLTELTATKQDEKKPAYHYPLSKQHNEIDQEDIWIKTLLELPDAVFPAAKKQVIKELFDPIEHNSFWKAPNQPSISIHSKIEISNKKLDKKDCKEQIAQSPTNQITPSSAPLLTHVTTCTA